MLFVLWEFLIFTRQRVSSTSPSTPVYYLQIILYVFVIRVTIPNLQWPIVKQLNKILVLRKLFAICSLLVNILQFTNTNNYLQIQIYICSKYYLYDQLLWTVYIIYNFVKYRLFVWFFFFFSNNNSRYGFRSEWIFQSFVSCLSSAQIWGKKPLAKWPVEIIHFRIKKKKCFFFLFWLITFLPEIMLRS